MLVFLTKFYQHEFPPFEQMHKAQHFSIVSNFVWPFRQTKRACQVFSNNYIFDLPCTISSKCEWSCSIIQSSIENRIMNGCNANIDINLETKLKLSMHLILFAQECDLLGEFYWFPCSIYTHIYIICIFEFKTKPHSLCDDTWWMLNAQCVIDSHILT